MSMHPATVTEHAPTNATPETLSELLRTHGVDLEADSRFHLRARRQAAFGIGELVLAGLGPSQALALAIAGPCTLRLIVTALALGAVSTVAMVALMRRSAWCQAPAEILLSVVTCGIAALIYAAVPEGSILGLHLSALIAGTIALFSAAVVATALVLPEDRQLAAARIIAPVFAVAGTFAAL